jgi:hypothetical protein
VDAGVAYLAVAVVSALLTWGLLQIVKNIAVVMCVTALLVSTGYVLWAQVTDGYSDKFWVIAFAVLFFYSAIVSIGSVYVGRFLGIIAPEKKNAS